MSQHAVKTGNSIVAGSKQTSNDAFTCRYRPTVEIFGKNTGNIAKRTNWFCRDRAIVIVISLSLGQRGVVACDFRADWSAVSRTSDPW